MAVTSDPRHRRRIPARWLHPAGVARAGKHLVEFAFEHRLQEFPRPLAKGRFDRIEPAVEKVLRRLDFRLQQARRRAIVRHGVISNWRPNAGIACWTKLEITPLSFSNHSRYGTSRGLSGTLAVTGLTR